jgi:alkylation response protein AidB-like acyl-CoA dehydrogenase
MDFLFSDDQLLLQRTVREFLEGEAPVARVRALWESETGRDRGFWKRFAEIGVPGLLVPEAQGGLGMDELDLVLLLEEVGRAALAEPVVATAAVGAPLVRELGGVLAAEWLPRIAAGDAQVAVGHPACAFVADAHVADLLLLPHAGELHALAPAQVALEGQRANDPARRIAAVRFAPAAATRVASGAAAAALLDAALDRGAVACAAQALGAAQRMIELAVKHACEREQFGVPIGSFQAVKHMLADVAVELEYARSVTYRAAHSLARAARTRAVDASMAKLMACEAAEAAAKTALQVHGAIGYTWEHDLHVWMRRAWTFAQEWGDAAWHRARLADAVIDGAHPAESFGYGAAGA